MEKYRVTLVVTDENGRSIGRTSVSSEHIDDVRVYRGTSALDEALNALLKEAEDQKVK